MKKLLYIYIIVAVSSLLSCTDNFEKYNEDRKQPMDVPGESLFSNALKDLTDQTTNTDVNLNVLKLFAQYWTETTYTDEANYDLINRTIPDNTFEVYYVDVLQDFTEAARIIREDADSTTLAQAEMNNKLAIIELLVCYTYQQLVDIFGDVPYSEALDIENVSPAYDDAATIYNDLISRVQTAVSQLNPGNDAEPYGSFGTTDFIYNGDVAAWKKFGNSLLIKLGITLADVNAALGKSTLESGVAGAFESAADNALFPYQSSSPNYNPIYDDLVASGRNDFVAANTIVDIMNTLNDPRRWAYFDTMGFNTFVGGPYGTTSPYSQYSHISQKLHDPQFPGVLMSYDEIQFYLAEASARGWNVGGATTEQLYNNAIAASFEFWGVPADSLATYMATPAVAWNTAQGDWKQKIGVQEWLAFYSRGLEGYTTWRRLDYPVLNVPEGITAYNEIPKRYTYPVNEQTLNRESWQAASEKIGGDLMTTRIFWDVFEPVQAP